MKPNKYKVKVTDENNKATNYKVEITGNSIQISYNTPRIRKLVFSYIAFFVLCALMCTIIFVKCNTSKDEYKNNSSYEVSIDDIKLETTNENFRKTSGITPIICMTIFCTAGVIFVFLVIIKDDGGLRFNKLNALMSLKCDTDSKYNTEIMEEECVNCPLQEKTDNTSSQKCQKIIKKNLYGEITKTLINSITEI